MNDTKYIGIDFGTTNCCISYTQYHPQQKNLIEPQIIEVNGKSTVQNTLAFEPDRRTLLALGEDVYESQTYLQHPEYVASEYKLRLSDPDAQHYASIMFGELNKALKRVLNVKKLNSESHQIVVGVPAQWSAEDSRHVLVAAAKGGFGEASPIPEPLGAMLYHAFTGDVSFAANPEYDLVLDFGGGTTDFVVLQMAQHWPTPRVVYVYGDVYGGRDFDQILMAYLRERFRRGQKWTPRNKAQLGLFARRFKERFSTAIARGALAYEQMCGLPRFESMVSLSRKDFESRSVAGGLLSQFSTLIEKGLEECGLAPYDFKRIILSGGSSRWYFVEDKLRKYFKDAEIIRSSLPEQTISKGLALYLADPNLLLARPVPQPAVNRSVEEPLNPFQSFQKETASTKSSQRQEIASTTPTTLAKPKRFGNVFRWGLLAWLVTLVVDMIGAGVPAVPDVTCICSSPIWLLALGISYYLDRQEKKRST